MIDLTSHARTHALLDEVHDERVRQDVKWGQQTHPNVRRFFQPQSQQLMGEMFVNQANAKKEIVDSQARMGESNWLDIFMEEVLEAQAETIVGTKASLRAELIQCAAVAINWVESIDRSGS